MAKKLTQKQVKIVAKAISTQLLRAIDSNAFDSEFGVDISDEETTAILNEIRIIADRCENEYSHIGNVGMLIESVKNQVH